MTDRSPPLLEPMNGLVPHPHSATAPPSATSSRSRRARTASGASARSPPRPTTGSTSVTPGFQLVAGLPDDGDGWKEASKEPEPELRVGDVVVYEHARAIHVALFGVAHVLVPLARLAARVVRRMREGVR